MTLYFGDLACLFCKQCRFPKDAAECRFGLETKAGEKKQKTEAKEPAKKQPSTVSASASALHASLAQQCEAQGSYFDHCCASICTPCSEGARDLCACAGRVGGRVGKEEGSRSSLQHAREDKC